MKILIIVLFIFQAMGILAQITVYSSNEYSQWNSKTMCWDISTNQEASIIINDEQHYQTIEGWGGCFNERGWKALQYLDKATQDEVLNLLFSEEGCDFSYCRMPIGASDYALDYYSLNDHPEDYAMKHFSIERDRKYLLPYIKAAQAIQPELQVWGSPWTPPAWMKVNKRYHAGSITMDAKTLEAYALYFQNYVEAYRSEGLDIVAVHPQNEPLHLPKFPSCGWTGEQLKIFIRDYLGPRFEANVPDCELWLGTINGNAETDEYEEYINTVFSDREAAKYLTGAGFQWDGDAAVEQMRASFPDKKLMQTETKCGWGTNDWSYAIETYKQMVWYLERGASYYQQWNMVLNETGMSSWGWKQNSMITVDTHAKAYRINPQYWLVRHFSQFIKPGARRIRSWVGETVQVLAFQNPNGDIVVVMSNQSDDEQEHRLQYKKKGLAIAIAPQTVKTIIIKSL